MTDRQWESFNGTALHCVHHHVLPSHHYYSHSRISIEGHFAGRRLTLKGRCQTCNAVIDITDRVENPYAVDVPEAPWSEPICQHPEPHIAENKSRNGKSQYRTVCDGCGARSKVIRKAQLEELCERHSLIIFQGQDRRSENPDCERCGASGTEYHHYAPRSIFADADDWPTGYLCVACHTEWHRATRTGAFDDRFNKRAAS